VSFSDFPLLNPIGSVTSAFTLLMTVGDLCSAFFDGQFAASPLISEKIPDQGEFDKADDGIPIGEWGDITVHLLPKEPHSPEGSGKPVRDLAVDSTPEKPTPAEVVDSEMEVDYQEVEVTHWATPLHSPIDISSWSPTLHQAASGVLVAAGGPSRL